MAIPGNLQQRMTTQENVKQSSMENYQDEQYLDEDEEIKFNNEDERMDAFNIAAS